MQDDSTARKQGSSIIDASSGESHVGGSTANVQVNKSMNLTQPDHDFRLVDLNSP